MALSVLILRSAKPKAKGDYIVLDIDSHASIWDGCKMGDAEVLPFRHNDIEAMEKRLRRIPEGAGKLVILEGVYSMLGDIAPLKEMIAVAKANGAMVLVDEAHSMGFIGPIHWNLLFCIALRAQYAWILLASSLLDFQ